MTHDKIYDTFRRRTRRPVGGIGLGAIVAGVGLGLVAAGMAARRPRSANPVKRSRNKREALRLGRDGAAIMGASVLFDSALEHLRGDFRRDEMYVAPLTGATAMAAALAEPRRSKRGRMLEATHLTSVGIGVAGMGFHLRNISRRPGGVSWNNLFYAAPLGAPGALIMSGLFGMVTHRMAQTEGYEHLHGRELAFLTALALVAESGEVTLLHFRGAFHDKAMYLPVTLPPLTAAGLMAQAIYPHRQFRRRLTFLLRAVEGLGYVGTGFHALGVARNSAGWRNWRQTTLAGPPMPAPISFAGLGKTGRAALDLLAVGEDQPRQNMERAAI
ncbi:hypothetical protein [Thioclava sp. F28-4]|uniref:hypothetical protein n=1 Tax=Thioclava sp. F28-4 TaxID=1915315 RepID=UPI000997DA9F|nr:hypothetical protein [Thioclava sp. F28-4]